jgi:hypothetical protein
MKVCHRCHGPWQELGQPGFNNTCAQCGIPLHSCGNCVYFLRSGQVRCAVPQAQRVLDWQAGNRCSYFEFQEATSEAATAAIPVGSANGAPRTAKDRWNQLFGK